MKKLTITAAAALAVALASSAFAADAESGAKLSADVCSKCHGPSGVSASPLFPNLAGQKEAYIDQQLKLFRERGRGDPHARAYMWGIAGPLTDNQIADLAAYFSAQKPVKGEPAADPALAAKGATLFAKGDESRGVPACATCHGEKAQGNDGFPRLAGQHGDYLIAQMEAFRGTLRESEVMHANASGLTNDDIKALAEYLSSL